MELGPDDLVVTSTVLVDATFVLRLGEHGSFQLEAINEPEAAPIVKFVANAGGRITPELKTKVTAAILYKLFSEVLEKNENSLKTTLNTGEIYDGEPSSGGYKN